MVRWGAVVAALGDVALVTGAKVAYASFAILSAVFVAICIASSVATIVAAVVATTVAATSHVASTVATIVAIGIARAGALVTAPSRAVSRIPTLAPGSKFPPMRGRNDVSIVAGRQAAQSGGPA